jgi:hypothetical protein
MSGIDKANLMNKLITFGWKEDHAKAYHLVPPEELWIHKPKSFYIYDALELQNILGEEEEA